MHVDVADHNAMSAFEPTADDLVAWLVATGLEGAELRDLADGFCSRLRAQGVRLNRAAFGSDLLHPLHFGTNIIWRPETNRAEQEFYGDNPNTTPDDPEGWLNSPFYRLYVSGDSSLRRRLDSSHTRNDIPLLDRFQDEGATDYLATMTRFGRSSILGDTEGVACSYLTHDPDGFSDGEIDYLIKLGDPFSLAYKSITTLDTSRTVMRTYLGDDAAQRVLDGDIRRGTAETIDAVLWYSDLQNFTRIADTTPRDSLMAFLNAYAELMVDVIHDHGGQVLKFMGDGVLGMFPRAGNPKACDSALDAAIALITGLDRLNEQRQAQSLPTTHVRLGLHRGEVLYGNIGSSARLDFTVIGPAVNEVARIEGMCRSLGQDIVISSAFAQSSTLSPNRVVSLGRYALRGVSRPQELFTIDADRL